MTTEELEALGATINFIEIWLKLLYKNYDDRRVAYFTDMKEMLIKIPTMMTKLLITRQKVHKLMTEIGGGWYMETFLRDYHH